MSRIIVSYLSGDQPKVGQSVTDAIAARFGAAAVANGVPSLIKPGDDYEDAITEAVDGSEGLIVIIGSQWGTAADWSREMNYDRLAILHAMNSKKRILPVMVDGAQLPPNLPEDLAKLGRRAAIDVQSSALESGLKQVMDIVTQYLGAPQTQVQPPAPQSSQPLTQQTPPMAQQPPSPQPYQTPYQQQQYNAPPQQYNAPPQQYQPPPQGYQQPPYNQPPQGYYPPQQQRNQGWQPTGFYGQQPSIHMGNLMVAAIVGAIAFAIYYVLSLEILFTADSLTSYALADGFLVAIAVFAIGKGLQRFMRVSDAAVTLAAIGTGVVSAGSVMIFDESNLLTQIALGLVVAFAYSEVFPSNTPNFHRLTTQNAAGVAVGIVLVQTVMIEISQSALRNASSMSDVRFGLLVIGAIAGALFTAVIFIGLSYSPTPGPNPPGGMPPGQYPPYQQPPRY